MDTRATQCETVTPRPSHIPNRYERSALTELASGRDLGLTIAVRWRLITSNDHRPTVSRVLSSGGCREQGIDSFNRCPFPSSPFQTAA